MKKFSEPLRLTQIAIFSSLAIIVSFFSFPIFFLPGLFKLDLSETIVLIGAFSLGPIAGVLIEILKIILRFIILGTRTAFIGELANLLVGLSLVVPSAILYSKVRDFKHAVIGMILGLFSMILVAAIINYFIIIPFYKVLVSSDFLIKLGFNNDINFILFAVIPFNFIKGLVSCIGAVILYKRLCKIINNFPGKPKKLKII